MSTESTIRPAQVDEGLLTAINEAIMSKNADDAAKWTLAYRQFREARNVKNPHDQVTSK